MERLPRPGPARSELERLQQAPELVLLPRGQTPPERPGRQSAPPPHVSPVCVCICGRGGGGVGEGGLEAGGGSRGGRTSGRGVAGPSGRRRHGGVRSVSGAGELAPARAAPGAPPAGPLGGLFPAGPPSCPPPPPRARPPGAGAPGPSRPPRRGPRRPRRAPVPPPPARPPPTSSSWAPPPRPRSARLSLRPLPGGWGLQGPLRRGRLCSAKGAGGLQRPGRTS